MKKLILMLVILMSVLSVNAQKVYDHYEQDGKKLSIGVDSGNNYLIEVRSMDAHKVCLILSKVELNELISNLKSAKKKYSEWKKIAKANNVTDLYKTIPNMGGRTKSCFLDGREWCPDTSTEYKMSYMIGEYVNALLVMNKSKLVSMYNEYVTARGFCMSFYNEKEIDNFLAKLDNKKIKKFLVKEKSKSELFK